ncbi:MAG TPA: antibiotic biosynthesis monooxygenase [Thermoanaerobaculia bacterium]|jgi:heme-degrading monooxygenase HmoA|nr:antibiotic biosynthesis monooxygenase [Thermoanaerobaculia bacterium]
MFSVIFEVLPRPGQADSYLGSAEALRTELERTDGFAGNLRYRSLNREGWILSLSDWSDEKAAVRWRTNASHHEAQGTGRSRMFADYRLRAGEITNDTRLPAGLEIVEQRFDETEAGEGTAMTLVEARRPAEWKETTNPADCSQFLGLDPYADGLLDWDVFEALQSPGELVLLQSWRTGAAAEAFELTTELPPHARLRRMRVIRDYGMFDRREAPQYYPEVARS